MLWIWKASPKLCAWPQRSIHTLLNYIDLWTPVFHDLSHVETLQNSRVGAFQSSEANASSRHVSSPPRNVFWVNVRCHLNSHIKVMQRSPGCPPPPPPPTTPTSPRVRGALQLDTQPAQFFLVLGFQCMGLPPPPSPPTHRSPNSGLGKCNEIGLAQKV